MAFFSQVYKKKKKKRQSHKNQNLSVKPSKNKTLGLTMYYRAGEVHLV